VSNQVIERKPNGQFAKGVSGNLGGNAQRTRHIFNKAFLEALAADFRKGGPEAIAKVRKQQPAAYMKICALLVPREMQVEHTNRIKQMTDEELEAAVELLQGMIDAKLAGANAKLVEEIAEPVALPGPDVLPNSRNKVLDAADTAVGARKRKPGKSRVPSPAGT
jgi:hypothetical protein